MNKSDSPKRKHLILYILDIPYFIIITLLNKILASVIFFPLFIILNATQALVFIQWQKTSLALLIGLALPKILLGLFQVSIYLVYLGAPIYYIESKYHPIDGYVNDNVWMKLLNYGAIYILLLILQFATLRRFSKRQLLGMALKNQGQQRGLFIKNILWLLSLVFCIFAILSIFGIKRLRSDYSEKKENHFKSKLLKRESVNDQRAINKNNQSCKVFFTHALYSMLMGYMDLLVKIAEVFIYLLVKISYAIMFVLPWRAKLLEERLKTAESIYVGAGLIIWEAFNTVLDFFLYLVMIPLILILTPYKYPYLKRDFKTLEVNQWRKMVFGYLIKTITDFPYIVMALVLCLSVVQVIRLKKKLPVVLARRNKKRRQNEQLEVGDILKEQILKHFLELFEVIFKTILLITGIILFLASTIFAPLRIYGNILKIIEIKNSYKNDFKKRDNLTVLKNAMIKNICDCFLDIFVLLISIMYLASIILNFWRIQGHIINIKLDYPFFKLNIMEHQPVIIKQFATRVKTNITNFFLDILVLLLLVFNVFGFWRYSYLYRKVQTNTLQRYDLLINPFLTICDLPWLVLVILCFVFMPWRAYTYYRLSLIHPHFPNESLNQMKVIRYDLVLMCILFGFGDYLYLPIILLSILNPVHVIVQINLFKFDMQYEDLEKMKDNEFFRRTVIRFYCKKSLQDIWHYFILFPLNMLTIYYVPLFRYMLNNKKKFIPVLDDDKFKKTISQDLYKAGVFFKICDQIQDFYQPQDARSIIKLVNTEFIINLPFLPLIVATLFFNPYRTYQFFVASDHQFKTFTYKFVQDMRIGEEEKRVDIVIKFKESLTDLLAFLTTIIIVLTGFRFLYLISILSVNGHITYFNGFLKRVSKSTILIIKLQQIETILSKPAKERSSNFLSLKYCIWLSFIELMMDILIAPFIVAYFVMIPWRLGDLFKIAVSQYERVPTKKVNRKHYIREVNHGGYPKRVQAVGFLFKYILSDYVTIILTAILILTVWRGLTTVIFLKNFYRYKFSKDKAEVEYLETVIKDTPLQSFVFKEFWYLLTDLFFLALTIITFLMVFQAKTLYQRLMKVFEKRKQRKEIQAFKVLENLKMMARFKKEIIHEEEDKQSSNKKKIVDLNKNTMSLLLPYLKQNEIQNVETMNKKMYVFANFWPVWKNVYTETHMKDARIPKDILNMTFEESEKLDYRAVCKRCFTYVKNNCQEEILPEMVDYLKGYRRVVLEEFHNSLLEFPTIYLFPIRILAFIADKIRRVMEQGFFFLDRQVYSTLNLPKQCLFQCAFGFQYSDTYNQYDQGFGNTIAYPWAHLSMDILKIYLMIIYSVRFLFTYATLRMAKLLSAGPVGNFQQGGLPPAGAEYNIIVAAPLYLLQFILMIPGFLWFWHPVIIMLYLGGLKIFSSQRYWYTEEINLVWIFCLCMEFVVEQVSRMNAYHTRFPYIQPLRIFSMLWQLVKFIINKLIGPVKAAANGTMDIAKFLIGKLIGVFSSTFKAVSKLFEQVVYIVYNCIKMILNRLWTGSKVTFEFIMIPIKGISSLYFVIFKFLLVALRSLGIVGEAIFTIFGLVWLLWPLFVGYKLGRTEFYIPAAILTIILIVQGRKVIISNQ